MRSGILFMGVRGARGALAIAAAALLGGCAGIPVHADYDAALGVARCHSFAWPEPSTEVEPFGNPINLKRLRAAVSAQFAAHGITEATEASRADCVASVSIGARNAVEQEPGGPWGPAWGWHGWAGWGWGGPWGAGWGFDEQYVYRQGSVSVNLFDARTHEPIWHATAERDVTALTGDAAQTAIDEAVRAVFARFPAR